jgi:hypothetical protein
VHIHPWLNAIVSDKGIFGLVSHEESELYMSLVVRKASIDQGYGHSVPDDMLVVAPWLIYMCSSEVV